MDEDGWGVAPPILTLLGLFEEHRAAFEYDWRTRFHVPLDDVPERMDWAEALRLTSRLLLDPSSHVAAAVAGWDYPVSREFAVTADLLDLLRRVHLKPPVAPSPRPWPDPDQSKFGSTSLSQDEIRAALAARGHT